MFRGFGSPLKQVGSIVHGACCIRWLAGGLCRLLACAVMQAAYVCSEVQWLPLLSTHTTSPHALHRRRKVARPPCCRPCPLPPPDRVCRSVPPLAQRTRQWLMMPCLALLRRVSNTFCCCWWTVSCGHVGQLRRVLFPGLPRCLVSPPYSTNPSISPFAVGLEADFERELTLEEMMGTPPGASGQLGSEPLALLALGVPAANTAQNTAAGSCGRLCTG